MKRRSIQLFIYTFALFVLSGCGIPDSDIPYNVYFENYEVTGASCGRGNQITVKQKEQENMKFHLSDSDCQFFIEQLDYQKHLKKMNRTYKIEIDFIAEGDYIDAIVLNEK